MKQVKYFAQVPESVFLELSSRGVDTDKIMFSAKADLCADRKYLDIYFLLDEKKIYIIQGIEKIVKKEDSSKISNKKDRYFYFDTDEFKSIDLKDIKSFQINRQINTARFVAEFEDGTKQVLCLFSIGFVDIFQKFGECAEKVKKSEEINMDAFKDLEYYCPKCGYRYPEKERKICPNCTDKMSIFKRLIKMYSKYKLSAFLVFGLLIVMSVLLILSPMVSQKLLFDEVLKVGGDYYGQVLFIVILMLIVNVTVIAADSIYSIILAKITPKITHDLRMNIFSSMQNLSINFFTSKQTGSLMSRVLNDSENIYWFFIDCVPWTIVSFIKVVGLLAVMLWLNAYITIFMLVAISITAYLAQRFNKKRRKLHQKRYKAVRNTYSVVSDTLNGQRVVKAFAKEKEEINRYEVCNKAMHDISYKISYEIQSTFPTIGVITRIASALMVITGGVLIINGHLTLGAVTTIISYSGMLEDPINFFLWLGERWARCVDAASRMFEILDSQPSVKESQSPIRIQNVKGDIEFRNVCFEYEAARPILTDISFKAPAGKMLGIVGKTGAGKTTIINLISRLYDTKSGEVLIDGTNVKDLAFEDLRRNIGIVSQETYLFMGSVADNIKYANPDATFDEVVSAAKAAYCHDFIMKLSDGYDTKIGVGGHDFSGGEKQRISIARALLQKPNILILDEATASMDTKTERNIQTAIDDLKKGRTIIAIAHRLSTLRDADKLIVIENGKVSEAGTHDELIHNKGVYFELHKLQTAALQFIENE